MLTGVALGAVLLMPAPASATSELPGSAVYAGDRVFRYSGGTWRTLVKTEDAARVAVSPDGRKAAWVTPGGWLQVRQGGRTTTLVSGLRGGTSCRTPVWSPDSARVAYAPGGDTIMVVRADASAAPRKLGTSPGICGLAWAANGRYVAGHTTGALYRLDVETGKTTKVTGAFTHLQSLSPDGREAIVARDGDAARFKPVVVDLATGKKRAPKVKGRLIGAHHLADGRMIVRVGGAANNTLVVLDGAGKELQRFAEPARARNQALLQILP